MGLLARSKPIRWGLLIAGLISLLLLVGCYEQPPYSKASGEQIHLVNNRTATDPTWARLQDFLLRDSTDDSKYTYSFVCADFAEALHNNAEASGIKTAFVVVDFAEGEPHALNAFLTSDYGLVYIDCTGEDTTLKYVQTYYPIGLFKYDDPEFTEEVALPQYSVEYDKIAFISEGSPFEVVSLGLVESPTTYGYESYQQGMEDFNKSRSSYDSQLDSYNSRAKSYYRDWVEYNAKVEAWNSGSYTYSYSVGGGIYALGYTKDLSYSQLVKDQKRLDKEYVYLESECSRLVVEVNKLLSTLQVLGYYSWDTLGVVKSIKIWW